MITPSHLAGARWPHNPALARRGQLRLSGHHHPSRRVAPALPPRRPGTVQVQVSTGNATRIDCVLQNGTNGTLAPSQRPGKSQAGPLDFKMILSLHVTSAGAGPATVLWNVTRTVRALVTDTVKAEEYTRPGLRRGLAAAGPGRAAGPAIMIVSQADLADHPMTRTRITRPPGHPSSDHGSCQSFAPPLWHSASRGVAASR
jgi:hypothetical protein